MLFRSEILSVGMGIEGYEMTTLKTLEMALEALEDASYCVQNDYLPDKMGHDWDEVIASLRTQIALEKKADNARELGLDYEPAAQRWAVFCSECKKEWSVSYPHPGKSVCSDCEGMSRNLDKPTAWVGLTKIGRAHV